MDSKGTAASFKEKWNGFFLTRKPLLKKWNGGLKDINFFFVVGTGVS